MFKNPVLEGIVVALAIIFCYELGQYFREPVAPDEKHLRVVVEPFRGLDPNRAPAAMYEDCRKLGKLLIATKTDGPDWVYECQ